jgi:hypothetical protein
MKIEKEYTGLESQFFIWDGWDDVGAAEYHFYDCTLRQDIGSFKKGDKIQCVFFSVEKSYMVFYDNDANELAKFKLQITALPWE